MGVTYVLKVRRCLISVLEARLLRSGLPIEGLKQEWEILIRVESMEKKVRRNEMKLESRRYDERQGDLRS